jgi:hypothetical protein
MKSKSDERGYLAVIEELATPHSGVVCASLAWEKIFVLMGVCEENEFLDKACMPWHCGACPYRHLFKW